MNGEYRTVVVGSSTGEICSLALAAQGAERGSFGRQYGYGVGNNKEKRVLGWRGLQGRPGCELLTSLEELRTVPCQRFAGEPSSP